MVWPGLPPRRIRSQTRATWPICKCIWRITRLINILWPSWKTILQLRISWAQKDLWNSYYDIWKRLWKQTQPSWWRKLKTWPLKRFWVHSLIFHTNIRISMLMIMRILSLLKSWVSTSCWMINSSHISWKSIMLLAL